jgi:hypothetical protein
MGRQEVSPAMRRSPFVVSLSTELGVNLEFSRRPVRAGYARADAVGDEGFSVRVRRTDRRRPDGVSLLHISASSDDVHLPSYQRLRDCLPSHSVAIDRYADDMLTLGVDIRAASREGKPKLALAIALREIETIARNIERLM